LITLQKREIMEALKFVTKVRKHGIIKIPVFITATTVTDIYYILKKSKGHDSTML